MALTDSLQKNIMGWGIIGVVIVLLSVVLIKFKSISGVACTSLYTFNTTANNCYLTTNSSITTAIASLGTTVDTFVTGISEPQNWVIIFIIALIGFAVLKLFMNKKN